MANDNNLWDDLELSGDYGTDEGMSGISLESILAEFKGNAYLDGDRKTPPDELQRMTDDILKEALGPRADATSRTARDPSEQPSPGMRGGGLDPISEAGIRSVFSSPEFKSMNSRPAPSGGASPMPRPAPEPKPEPEMGSEPKEEPEERPGRGLFRRRRERTAPDPEPREDGPEEGFAPEPERQAPEPVRPAAEQARHTPEAARPHREKRPKREYAGERVEPAYDTAPEIDLSVFDEPEEKEKRPSKREGIDRFIDSIDRKGPETPAEEEKKAARYARRGAEEIRRIPTGEPEDPEDGEPEDFEEEEEERPRGGLLGRLFHGRSEEPEEPEDGEEFGDEDLDEPEEEEEEEDYYIDIEPDPDFRKAASKYANRVPSLRFRVFGAFVVVVLMALTTWLFTAGKAMPLIGHTWRGNVAGLLIMELIVAALGMDVLTRGLEDILTLQPGAESLVFVSTAMSVIDGFVMLVTGNYDRGLPMAVISAVSIMAALSARKSFYMAYCDSLKGARATSASFGVATDTKGMEDRRILKKISGEAFGFYAKLTSPDQSEKFYDDVSPLLVIASFSLAFIATVGHADPGGFTHTFSILTAVSAAFPATALFALPFKYAASTLRHSGAAIAGYAGARDITESDGALITDLDLFPAGSVRMEGVKLFEGVDRQKALAASASLVIASDSGLRRLFEEFLKSQTLQRKRVDDFACYDGGGIGGLVDGQRVLVGTGAFMSLMGLRVPEAMNTVGSVFAAVDDELVCMYSLSYAPSGSVQSSLVSLLAANTNILMAVRDFNVTPNTVKQRFKVSMDGVEYLPIETAYSLSRNELPEGGGVSAMLCRTGLAPFAEVINRGKLLKLITDLNTVISCAGTAISGLVMFYLSWCGAYAAASALNILLFMSLIGAFVYIMSQAVRKKLK